MASLQDNHDPDEDGSEKEAKAVGEMIVHFIQIDDENDSAKFENFSKSDILTYPVT